MANAVKNNIKYQQGQHTTLFSLMSNLTCDFMPFSLGSFWKVWKGDFAPWVTHGCISTSNSGRRRSQSGSNNFLSKFLQSAKL